MKKLFVGIAATMLAAAMCISFAACGDSSAKDVKGAEITAEQWNAAMDVFEKDDAKYTVEFEMKQVYNLTVDATSAGGEKKSGSVTAISKGTYMNNGAKQSAKGEGEVTFDGDYAKEDLMNNLHLDEEQFEEMQKKTEMYAEKATSGYTVYTQDEEGKWTKDGKSSGLIPVSYYAPDGDFADYKYDETLRGYVDKDYKAEDTEYTVYKFNSDGQLIAIYSYVGYSQGVEAMKMTLDYETSLVISYTASEITIPTVE